MGLDMYLKAKAYVFTGSEDFPKLAGIAKSLGADEIDSGIELTVAVGYWRKANAIHAWFVKNVQDGVDECQQSYVERAELRELLEVCKSVVKNRGGSLEDFDPASVLPTQSGFFFGGTEYDDWYYNDVENTIKVIERVLNMPTDWDFYYRSSW